MNRLVKIFLITWAGVFIVSFFTADDISLLGRISATAVLACIVPLLSLGKGDSKQSSASNTKTVDSGKNCTIHKPLDPHVLYRVENGKVYEEYNVAPVYEVKRNKIYPTNSPRFLYRIERGKIYKGTEPVPFLEIRGNKIYRTLSSKVEYEIHSTG